MQTKGRSLAEPDRSDVDLAAREITVRGKGGRPRAVKLSYEAAWRLDRYLRARSRHQLAWRIRVRRVVTKGAQPAWVATGALRGTSAKVGIKVTAQ